MQTRLGEFKRETRQIEVRADSKGDSVELSFSSELPVNRGDYMEILSHDPKDVDLSRLAGGDHPLLLGHDLTKQIGVVTEARIIERRGKARVKFSNSQLGKEIADDVRRGIRKLISVGYRLTKELSSEIRDGVEYIRFAWQPYEISVVPVPADPSVGIGRAAGTESFISMIEQIDSTSAERNRICEITAIKQRLAGKVPGLDEACEAAIANGTAVRDLQDQLFAKLPGVRPVSRPMIEVPTRDLNRYSLSRAILSHADRGVVDGVEGEYSQEIARVSGMKPNGFFIPPAVMAPVQTRADLVAGTATLGGNLIATDLMAGSFIDMLRNKSFVVRLGARVLAGLVGNVSVPRQYAGSTAYWVANETASATQSDVGFDQISLSPKCLTAWVNYSKQALIQSTPAIDALVRDDINMKLALTMDLSALHSQTNGPTPISETTGITTVACGTDGGAPAFSHLVSLETAVATGNADQSGGLAFLTNPLVRGVLRQTEKGGSVTEGFCWADNNTILGYGAYATNQIASNLTKGTATTICSAIYFGNWSDLLIGQWGGIDVVADYVTGAATRMVKIYAHQFADMAVRHPESFAVILDALTG